MLDLPPSSPLLPYAYSTARPAVNSSEAG